MSGLFDLKHYVGHHFVCECTYFTQIIRSSVPIGTILQCILLEKLMLYVYSRYSILHIYLRIALVAASPSTLSFLPTSPLHFQMHTHVLTGVFVMRIVCVREKVFACLEMSIKCYAFRFQ